MDTDIIIAGAGPVGLLLAAEIRLAGGNVTVFERRAERTPYSKALIIHSRSVEVLAMRGIADRFLAAGQPVPGWHYAGLDTRLDFSILDTPFNFTLQLPQARTEQLLEEHALSLGVDLRRQHEVVAVAQDPDRAEVTVDTPDGPRTVRARYLVGCDGGNSLVRTAAGIDFPGNPSTITTYLGETQEAHIPPNAHIQKTFNEAGALMVVPLSDGGYRFIGADVQRTSVAKEVPLTFDELRESVRRIAGTDFGMAEPMWLSRVGNASRQAATYRQGRVLLAGDAAHIHFPAAGQGLNVGIQDAFNLGWKLAAVLHGQAPDALLDSYHAERHPVAERVLHDTLAQSTLMLRQSPDVLALREVFGRILAEHPAVNADLAGQVAGLTVRYPASSPAAHPLVGWRTPNLALTGRSEDLFSMLSDGRFVLLNLGGDETLTTVGKQFADRAVLATDSLADANSPEWTRLGGLLVRPDGHVAWAADLNARLNPAHITTELESWLGSVRTTR